MGHRDSSATLGRASAFRSSGGGIGAPAPQCRSERAPERADFSEMSRTARLMLLAVRVYQTFFSALMPSACKFYPSCSQYAVDALRLHGARRGSWLALPRPSRCPPFTPGGVDLVPDAENSSRAAQTAIPKHSGDEAHS